MPGSTQATMLARAALFKGRRFQLPEWTVLLPDVHTSALESTEGASNCTGTIMTTAAASAVWRGAWCEA